MGEQDPGRQGESATQGESELRTAGLRHVALNVLDVDRMLFFYRDVLGMAIEWRPDPDNVYLTSGNDNLALHRVEAITSEPASLDHIGFILDTPEIVDRWYERFVAHDITILQAPKTHRDGARSFYASDPEGTTVQMIFHPPLAPAVD
ncbi:MAG: VOC family protein [Pseudomonadota bacterium]